MSKGGWFVTGVLATMVAVAGGGWGYLKFGQPPVAVADPAFPKEAQVVHVPLGARIAREQQKAPFAVNKDVLEAGANIYVAECAACHGTPGVPVDYAKWMYPATPQLWQKHAKGNVVGVSDDEVGETFWKVKNGIRLTGMPAFQHILSEDEMWDVSLLVKSADQPMPAKVQAILAGPVK